MPITSKKQSKAKADWMKENSKMFAIRVMKTTEAELFEFLSRQKSPSVVIKAALKEYMTTHPAE